MNMTIVIYLYIITVHISPGTVKRRSIRTEVVKILKKEIDAKEPIPIKSTNKHKFIKTTSMPPQAATFSLLLIRSTVRAQAAPLA